MARTTGHAVHLLGQKNVRAIVAHDEGLAFYPGQIVDGQDSSVLDGYWRDPRGSRRGLKTPGRTTYVPNQPDLDALRNLGNNDARLLTADVVRFEVNQAGLVVSEDAVSELHEKMLLALNRFSEIFSQYMNLPRERFVARAWTVFAPKGVLGRTPFLHADDSYLTGLWYADRAPARAYIGDVPDEVWQALQPMHSNKGKKNGKQSRKKNAQDNPLLQEFTLQADPEDFHSFSTGALIVTRNLRNPDKRKPLYKNLSAAKDQNTVCLHSSGDVLKYGQAGLVMVPQIIRTP